MIFKVSKDDSGEERLTLTTETPFEYACSLMFLKDQDVKLADVLATYYTNEEEFEQICESKETMDKLAKKVMGEDTDE